MIAGFDLAALVALVALGCVLAGAVADVMRFEIPDGLSIALLATALVYGLLTPGFGWISHLAAPLLMFGFGLFVFSRGWLGGGDVKLLVSTAAWTGLAGLALQFVAIAIAGGGLSLVLLVARAGFAGADAARVPRVFQKDAPLPYAVAIAAGTCWWAAQAWPVR